MASMTVIEAVRSTLDEALGKDERVFILGEDVEAGGVFRVTEGLAAKYPGRLIDSPLAESSIIGITLGGAPSWSAPRGAAASRVASTIPRASRRTTPTCRASK